MARALLLVPNFWDPLCPPVGISALKAYAQREGHQVNAVDFNTVGIVGRTQRDYFDEGRAQLPSWRDWNVERNGAEAFALHQILFLFHSHRQDYPDLVAEVLNLDRGPIGPLRDQLDVERLDAILAQLYSKLGQRLDQLLERTNPEVVGCTLNNSTWPGALFCLQRAKQWNPEIRTVVGGPGPLMGIASRVEEVRTFFDSHDFLDHYVLGEGEEGFLRVLNEPDLPPGILDIHEELPLRDAKRASLRLDSLPLPDYSDLRIPRYLLLSATTSRGCPFECSFCSETMFWSGFRKNDSDLVFQNLDAIAQRHGRSSFFICDSLSNHVIEPLTREIIRHGRPYKLDCYLRADEMCTDPARVRRWREGGLFRARLGLESASNRILDAMVKMTNPDRISRSLHALSGEGVMTSTLWIINYPGETEAEFEETLRFVADHRECIYQADAAVYTFHPDGLAGSETIAEERGSDLRFSSQLNDLLGVTPYRVARGHSITESFERLRRWVLRMRELGIPNPYRIGDWSAADERWRAMGKDSGWNPRRSLRKLKGS